jgi:hypothetical protein
MKFALAVLFAAVAPQSATELYRIHEPGVNQRMTEYRNVTFSPGRVVTVDGGGCVQRNGPSPERAVRLASL